MITIKQVEHVAKLAKLSLDEDEKVKFTDQLGKIISYVELLNEVNTENVEPMTQAVPKINVMREDEITSPVERDELLASCPDEEDGYIKVPKIIEE